MARFMQLEVWFSDGIGDREAGQLLSSDSQKLRGGHRKPITMGSGL